MRIPRYWARAADTAQGPARPPFRLEAWGWSDRSVADALQVARRRLSEVAARVASGGLSRKYPYGERPLREEIVRTLDGAGGASALPARDTPDTGFRIYRTRSGYRVLATDLLLDPASERTRALWQRPSLRHCAASSSTSGPCVWR